MLAIRATVSTPAKNPAQLLSGSDGSCRASTSVPSSFDAGHLHREGHPRRGLQDDDRDQRPGNGQRRRHPAPGDEKVQRRRPTNSPARRRRPDGTGSRARCCARRTVGFAAEQDVDLLQRRW